MDNIVQGSPEWHLQRLGKVTASRVADVLATTKTGVSASRGNYLIELAIQRATGMVGESFTNAAMEWGTEQEPYARMKYEVLTGNLVDQVSFLDHPTIDWFGCSPDGMINKDGLIEIKCPNSATHWGYIKTGAPKKYITQMQTQMCVTGREWCDFVSFDPRMPEKSRIYVQRYDRDEKYIKTIEEEVQKFLEEVATETKLMIERE